MRLLRKALLTWVLNRGARAKGEPPEQIRAALDWLSRNTRPVGDLAEAELARRLLDALTKTYDDKKAAAGTVQRRRGVIVNALEHAVEWKLLVSRE